MNWESYHSTVREAIGGFDKLLTTLWVQGLAFGGAAVAAINPADKLDNDARFVIESLALGLSLFLFGLMYFYSELLKRAVRVGIEVERQVGDLNSPELKLTEYLDSAWWRCGSGGHLYYKAASLLVPVFITVLLAFDAAGRFD